MKNTAYIIVILFAMLGRQAVASPSQPSGDTIRWLPPSYLFNLYSDPSTMTDSTIRKWTTPFEFETHGRWVDPGSTDPIEHVSQLIRNGNFIAGNQLWTDRPIKIVGIAACAYMQRPGDTTIDRYLNLWESEYYRLYERRFFVPNTRDTSLLTRITDSMILYKPTPDGLVELMSAPWRIEQNHRTIVLPPFWTRIDDTIGFGLFFSSEFGRPDPIHPFLPDTAPKVPLYEIMFEKPVVVEDSFVVAGTALNNDGSYGWVTVPAWDDHPQWMWLWDHNPTRYWSTFTYEYDPNNTAEDNIVWRKHRHHEWFRWQTSHSRYYGTYVGGHFTITYLIYPIIDPDFDTVIEHCRPVTNLRVAASSDTSATLIWDADNSIHWEVRYGMMGMDDSLYTSFIVTSPSATLTGLAPGVQYKAVVRGWCPCDSSWSDWTSKAFSVQQQQDIAQPGNLGRFTHLSPNPAHGSVSVVSSFQLSRIVLYDLSGRRMLEQEADGISATLDISSLAPGSYIAAIHTPHGVATKKLIVK